VKRLSTTPPAPVISPVRHRAVIFDLDGVVTDTASVHAAAWRRLFDEFLAGRPNAAGEDHRPFTDEDYLAHVDGRSRFDGVSTLLRSRGVYLPAGNPDDPPERLTRHGLANRKDGYFQQSLATGGVRVFPDTVALIRQLRRHAIPLAVVSASRNAGAVLGATGLTDLFQVRVDGVLADRLGLPGKPDPALFLEAARRLGVPPGNAVVVEDARAGVLAGHRGGFGLVIGVARTGDSAALQAAGADVVVSDLAEVTVSTADSAAAQHAIPAAGGPDREAMAETEGSAGRTGTSGGARLSSLPDALAVWDSLLAPRLASRRIAVFCDFDGTLSPIVAHPDAAFLPAGTRGVLARLARHCPVGVISGRDLTDVRARVGLSGLWYAGSHGVELAGPGGVHDVVPAAEQARPVLAKAAAELSDRLGDVPGVFIEPKHFTVSVHYRAVPRGRVAEVVDTVARVAARNPELVVLNGRRVAELQPDIDWNKGQALRWLLNRFDHPDATGRRLLPVYAGDDITDEYALEAIRDNGIGIVVRSDEHGDRPTAAYAAVSDPAALCRFLARVADLLEHQASPRWSPHPDPGRHRQPDRGVGDPSRP
jgi:trehalose-phosphatase